MSQLHKRFTDEQIKLLFQSYCQGQVSRADLQEMIGIGKSRFFVLLKAYRSDPDRFTITYQRKTHSRISPAAETEIEKALLQEKAVVEDPDLPISGYNYSAMKDRLEARGIQVSVTTIINRAKKLDCHKPRKKRKTHDREVLTSSIGALIQHDASTHKWSPFAKEKWALITSIDDFSRKLLYADFVPRETTWAHIQATEALSQQYGLPLLRYYVDSLRVFRFVQGRDSVWRKHVLETDDVDTQWRKVMRLLGVDVATLFPLTSKAGGRTLKIGHTTRSLLKEHQKTQFASAVPRDPDWTDKELVFAEEDGSPIGPRKLQKAFKRALGAAGLPDIRFHDLRHTAATHMLANGVDVLTVSRRLGHTKASTTLDIYGHAIPGLQEKAAAIMNEITTPVALPDALSPPQLHRVAPGLHQDPKS